MRIGGLYVFALAVVIVAVVLVVVHNLDFNRAQELLNVSYAPTGELYQEIDRQFIAAYEKAGGPKLVIRQSHGGSSRQSRAVINGLEADVVTLALPSDVEALHKHGLLADGWAARLPNNSRPYTSTIVFVVRKGNPKAVHDWPDLVAGDVAVITPSPKSSGNGKLSFLAAWGSVVARGGTEDQARDYVQKLYQHVQVLGGSATEAASTFAYDKVGDVHLTWENEALQEVAEAKGELEIVYPPVSIRAEPTVAWVDANVARHHTEAEARAYWNISSPTRRRKRSPSWATARAIPPSSPGTPIACRPSRFFPSPPWRRTGTTRSKNSSPTTRSSTSSANPKPTDVRLPAYNVTLLRRDLLAGLTVAAISLPQAMAYALIAGVDRATGCIPPSS